MHYDDASKMLTVYSVLLVQVPFSSTPMKKIADLVPWAPLYVYIIGNEIQVVTRYMKKYEAFFDKYGNIMNNYQQQQQPHGCGIWCTTVLSVFAQS